MSFSPTACPKWAFGPGCSDECRCIQQNTLECHRRHGTCVCKPGYKGSTCKEGEQPVKLLSSSQEAKVKQPLPLSVECDPGTFGARCESRCACAPGVSCHHVTGDCQRKCPPGRHGQNCGQGTRHFSNTVWLSCFSFLLMLSSIVNSGRLSRGHVWSRLCTSL